MDIKIYSKKNDSDISLSKNFVVREFACKDGSDTILVDKKLVLTLQTIRDHFNAPVIINSGYRTEAYNQKVGGSRKSMHMEGRAADIKVTGAEPIDVCKYAESINIKGIGLYNSFTHVDTRTVKYYWDCRSGAEKSVSGFGGTECTVPVKTLRYGDIGNDVRWIQQKLSVTVDGIFGKKTETAVMAFQRRNGLVQDGIVGKKTLAALEK